MHVLELGSCRLMYNSINSSRTKCSAVMFNKGYVLAWLEFYLESALKFNLCNMVSLIYLLLVSTCNMVLCKKILVILVICYYSANILFMLD